MKKRIIVSLNIIILTILYSKTVLADAGFSGSYSSHSSSSSYSSSGGDGSGGGFTIFKDNGNGKLELDLDGCFTLIIFIICIALICVITNKLINRYLNKLKVKKQEENEKIENEIKKLIPNFNKDKFLNDGFKIYYDVQIAWMNFELNKIKDKITDEMYSMYETQLETLRTKNQQNLLLDINLESCSLKGVTYQNGTITISTTYSVSMYDYIANKTNGEVIRGNNTEKTITEYELKFRKTLNENLKIDKCPNCGAEIKINSAGNCKYCGSKLVSENTNWVLTKQKVLDQTYIDTKTDIAIEKFKRWRKK